MMRSTSLLTIPMVMVFGLTLAATSADAGHKHYGRDNCETRIFQGEEEACYRVGDAFLLFSRGGLIPDGPEASLAAPQATGGFSLNGQDCRCQLGRKNDLICAGGGAAVIGNVDRRGRRIVGEILASALSQKLARAVAAGDIQEKFTARRVDLANCELKPDK